MLGQPGNEGGTSGGGGNSFKSAIQNPILWVVVMATIIAIAYAKFH
jgi:hypothetical protein